MTTRLAMEYIPRRMKELGYGDNYVIRFRHFSLKPCEKITVEADNQYFILMQETTLARISSEVAVYDLSNTEISEHGYEHQGTIEIQNYSLHPCQLRFIQVVPTNK